MIDQLSLPGMPDAPRPTDGIFFALFPEGAVLPRITRTAEQLRSRHALSGRPLLPERFHVTLSWLGDFHGLPEALIRTARDAADQLSARPFEVRFDRAGSFKGRPGNHPLVLRGDCERLMHFQQDLGTTLKRVGLGRHVSSQFIPHVTLLYDATAIAEEAVDPISWSVHEFVLVHSLLGKTQHSLLGRWPLRG